MSADSAPALVWEVVLPDGQIVPMVRSHSSPFRFYAVVAAPDGRWTCGCPGARYRGRCRHITALSRQHAPTAARQEGSYGQS